MAAYEGHVIVALVSVGKEAAARESSGSEDGEGEATRGERERRRVDAPVGVKEQRQQLAPARVEGAQRASDQPRGQHCGECRQREGR